MKKVYNKKVAGKSSYKKLFPGPISQALSSSAFHIPRSFRFSTSDLDGESFRWNYRNQGLYSYSNDPFAELLANFPSRWSFETSVLNFARNPNENILKLHPWLRLPFRRYWGASVQSFGRSQQTVSSNGRGDNRKGCMVSVTVQRMAFVLSIITTLINSFPR